MSEWSEYALADVATIQIGGTPSREVDVYWAGMFDSGFPWVSIADLRSRVIEETKERITEKGVSNSNVKPVSKGTLIMSFKLSIGRAALAGVNLFTNEAIAAIVTRDGRVNPELLYYVLPPAAKLAITDTAVKGSTLNKASLGKLRIKVPNDYGKQAKIANILQTIDQTIEKTETLIEKYQQIKAGLMHDLFTRGIGADGKLRPSREQAPELYQESSIGWIPREWQYELLDKLAHRASGHTPNKNVPSYWNGGIKWVSLADSNKLDRLYVYDTMLEISQLGIQNSSALLHPAGTVVMTRDAGVGKSAVLAESMAVSQHFMAWICREKIDNHFLYYWLQHNKRTFENVAMGSTIVTIGLPFFKKLRLAAPVSIEEQREIGKRLTTADEQLFALETELAKSRELKAGLMHDLLTGKVQVKVDPPEAVHV